MNASECATGIIKGNIIPIVPQALPVEKESNPLKMKVTAGIRPGVKKVSRPEIMKSAVCSYWQSYDSAHAWTSISRADS